MFREEISTHKYISVHSALYCFTQLEFIGGPEVFAVLAPNFEPFWPYFGRARKVGPERNRASTS